MPQNNGFMVLNVSYLIQLTTILLVRVIPAVVVTVADPAAHDARRSTVAPDELGDIETAACEVLAAGVDAVHLVGRVGAVLVVVATEVGEDAGAI